ncbi:MAG: ArsR family transcriptional regulator [Haloquadratum sp.]
MRLTVPTDFEILEALADGERNNAANLAYHIDRDRSYINTRLPVLADYGLLERVGPAPNSGLYAITERGRAALEHRDAYRQADVDFEALIEREVGEPDLPRASATPD